MIIIESLTYSHNIIEGCSIELFVGYCETFLNSGTLKIVYDENLN